MNPINFTKVNRVLSKPPDMSVEECGSLPVYSDGQMCVSCWELTDGELDAIVKTRRIYCAVFAGESQPPILLTPFVDLLIP